MLHSVAIRYVTFLVKCLLKIFLFLLMNQFYSKLCQTYNIFAKYNIRSFFVLANQNSSSAGEKFTNNEI